MPSAIPTDTPAATLYMSIDFLNAPLVKFWTVAPKAFRAGSANVAPKPSKNAKTITMIKPNVSGNMGDEGLAAKFINAAGSMLPV
tara:strand:+ start:3807 stop:4061 length:255 start_codon:yes stop_codon:yes gene_type:complete